MTRLRLNSFLILWHVSHNMSQYGTSQERLKGVNYAVNRVASAKKVCDNDKTIVAFEIIRSQSQREEPFFVWFVISSEITGGYCSCIR